MRTKDMALMALGKSLRESLMPAEPPPAEMLALLLRLSIREVQQLPTPHRATS